MRIVEALLPSVVVLVGFVIVLRAIVRSANNRTDQRLDPRSKP